MRRNVNSSVDTVNAAASAIVSAESRVQPSSSVQKKRWRNWWSLNCCFGSQKNNNRRINHAVLVPEPVTTGSLPAAPPITNSTSIFIPFIAPPSSPSSFLQSGPSSVSHTPPGLLSLTVNKYTEPPSQFAIGPYANETQPVTPPIFSAFTTEPSTAPFTPTTPSSPEVPFAQLLASGMSKKFSAAHYEFRTQQVYPGSPGGNLISPGSVISNSGTSSPYPGKCSIIEFRIGEPPKFLGFEHFTARKWGSRFGSGSITPAGQGSGALTPNGGNKIVSDDVASLANSDHDGEVVSVDHHRVSFELTGEDFARCYANKINRADGLHEAVSGKVESEQSPKVKSFSLGSSKEFKFDNANEEINEWWENEKVFGKGNNSPGNSWSFFPVLRS